MGEQSSLKLHFFELFDLLSHTKLATSQITELEDIRALIGILKENIFGGIMHITPLSSEGCKYTTIQCSACVFTPWHVSSSLKSFTHQFYYHRGGMWLLYHRTSISLPTKITACLALVVPASFSESPALRRPSQSTAPRPCSQQPTRMCTNLGLVLVEEQQPTYHGFTCFLFKIIFKKR